MMCKATVKDSNPELTILRDQSFTIGKGGGGGYKKVVGASSPHKNVDRKTF